MKQIMIILGCLTLLACGDNTADPSAVAERYWDALQKGDKAAIEALIVTLEPTAEISIFSGEMTMDGDKVREIRLAEALIDGDKARVPTVIVPALDSQTGGVGEISFDTQLLKLDGHWKIDKKTTEANLMAAALAAAMGAMGEAFTKGMDEASKDMHEAVELIGEAVTEGLQAMVEGLAEGLSEGLEMTRDGADEMASQDTPQPYVPPVVLPARVSGSIRGTGVELNKAQWSHNLAIYSGDGWGFNPSLLIFLFLPEGELPVDRTMTVKATEGGFNHPHVHYRWRNPETGNIETQVVSSDYDMEITFGKRIGQRVSGEIQFAVPDEDSHVAGSFQIELGPQALEQKQAEK